MRSVPGRYHECQDQGRVTLTETLAVALALGLVPTLTLTLEAQSDPGPDTDPDPDSDPDLPMLGTMSCTTSRTITLVRNKPCAFTSGANSSRSSFIFC